MHDVTIQISDSELEGIRDPSRLFPVGVVNRLREAVRALPRPVRVGDMVDPVNPGHRIAGRRWPAEVVALRDGVVWLWFDGPDGPRSGIWNLSDVEVV